MCVQMKKASRREEERDDVVKQREWWWQREKGRGRKTEQGAKPQSEGGRARVTKREDLTERGSTVYLLRFNSSTLPLP